MTGAVEPVRLRWLVGGTGAVTALEAVAGLDLVGGAHARRPYLVSNMVSTADGRATIAGRTRSIGNQADRELFHALRTRADAVMVGARTVRTERYGRLVRDPQLEQARLGAGVREEPLACVVSASLELAPDLPLLADPGSHVIVITSSEDELAPCAARVEYLRTAAGASLDLTLAMARLRADWDVRAVLCEGGPGLNAELLPLGLVDELFLSVAPKLAGGSDALTIVAGAPLKPTVELELRWLLENEGHLFARYGLLGG